MAISMARGSWSKHEKKQCSWNQISFSSWSFSKVHNIVGVGGHEPAEVRQEGLRGYFSF